MEKEYRISDLIAYLESVKMREGDLPITREYNRGGVEFFQIEDIEPRYIAPRLPRERTVKYAGRSYHRDAKELNWTKVLAI